MLSGKNLGSTSCQIFARIALRFAPLRSGNSGPDLWRVRPPWLPRFLLSEDRCEFTTRGCGGGVGALPLFASFGLSKRVTESARASSYCSNSQVQKTTTPAAVLDVHV